MCPKMVDVNRNMYTFLCVYYLRCFEEQPTRQGIVGLIFVFLCFSSRACCGQHADDHADHNQLGNRRNHADRHDIHILDIQEAQTHV